MYRNYYEFKIGLVLLISLLGVGLIGAKRIAALFESTTIRWIKACKRIKAEWQKPLTLEKPSQRQLNRKHSRRELGSGDP